jgi:hypothetical protein
MNYEIAGIYSSRTTPKIHITEDEPLHYLCGCKVTGSQSLTSKQLQEVIDTGEIKNYFFGNEYITIFLCKKCLKKIAL